MSTFITDVIKQFDDATPIAKTQLVWLDHDLGAPDYNGRDVSKWIAETAHENEGTVHLIAHRNGTETVTRCGLRGKWAELTPTIWWRDVDCEPCADPSTPFPAQKP